MNRARRTGAAETATPAVPAPAANPRLLGQSETEAVLRRAHDSGTLAHAWLFTGPRGIGKATLAFRFARFLLSTGAKTAAAEAMPGLFGEAAAPPAPPAPAPADLATDPESPVFRRVASGGHPDLFLLTRRINDKTGKPAKEIGVDEVRAVGHFLHLTAAEGGWRVVIVDSADDLNANAANALLKVLEEPPPRSLLLLIGHRPARLLPTIRSRCCRLALPVLAEAEVEELLGAYLPELSADQRAAIAGLAEGSIGRAIELAAGGGLELYGQTIELLGDLPTLDPARLYALGDRLLRGDGEDRFALWSELYRWWLARLLRARTLNSIPAEIVPGEAALTRRLLAAGRLEDWLALWEKSNRLLARAERANLDRKQTMVGTLLDLEALSL